MTPQAQMVRDTAIVGAGTTSNAMIWLSELEPAAKVITTFVVCACMVMWLVSMIRTEVRKSVHEKRMKAEHALEREKDLLEIERLKKQLASDE